MTRYYRVMLGEKSIHAEDCIAGNFIGVDYGIKQNLTGKLPKQWRDFNKEFIPVYLKNHPGKGKISAGLACGTVWTMAKGIETGDRVLSHVGGGHYRVGQVVGDYAYAVDQILPHRRPVNWLPKVIERDSMGAALRKVAGNPGTVNELSAYSDEIEKLIGSSGAISSDGPIDDPAEFEMEQQLEAFLVQNWAHTELGKEYNIYEEDGETVGQQYKTDTGPMDILAISKDKKRLLVVELKKGRASDAVVGQTLRYMGYVREMLADKKQTVHGVIIAQDDDQRIRRALMAASNIDFYRYQVSFKLVKG